MKITHVNPDGLYKSPAFSQAVVTEGGKTIYIGGQNGILSDGTMAGDNQPLKQRKHTRIELRYSRPLKPRTKTSSRKPFTLSKDRTSETVLPRTCSHDSGSSSGKVNWVMRPAGPVAAAGQRSLVRRHSCSGYLGHPLR